MKVSIIIPVYNVEDYIEDCLRSVIRQVYSGNIECIIVDDCGTDNSIALAEGVIASYKGPIQFKILHHQHNRGLSAARNTGMDVALGDYVFFLDSDDELTDDGIATLTKPLETERYDVVLGFVAYRQVLSANHIVGTNGPQELNIKKDILLRPPKILQSYKKQWAVVAWNRLYRTEFIKRNHLSFKEGLLYEDNLWSFQIACLAQSLYIVSHTTYIHKIREGSIMTLGTRKDVCDSQETILKEMRTFVDVFQIKNADVFPFFNSTFCSILNYYSHSGSKEQFFHTYDHLRPYVKASLRQILHADRFRLRGYARDFHYLLPKNLAPAWQHSVYKKIRPAIIQIYYKMRLLQLGLFPKAVISRKWKRRMGYPLDWENPRDINEKIQWLMVNSDISEWTRLADKDKVRDYVKEKGLGHLLLKQYGVWENAEQIDFDALPNRFVLKCNHDFGSTIIVDKTSPDFNRNAICERLNNCLKRNFAVGGEIHYRHIPPRVIAEEYLELTDAEKEVSSSQIDYKVWCFDGKPYWIWCFLNRSRHCLNINVYDLEWNPHPEYIVPDGHLRPGEDEIPKPKSLAEMLDAASILSKGFPQVRVDFYDIDGKLYFGEMTFTSNGGMMKCFTPEYLKILGDKTVIR